MKQPSLEEFSALVGDIHDAGSDGTMWPGVLERIARMLGGRMTTVWLQDASGRVIDWRQVGEERGVGAYFDYYWQKDALLPAVMAAPVATVLSSGMVSPPAERSRSEFWADFARPNDLGDCLHVRLFDEPAASGFLAVGSSLDSDMFGAEAIRLAGLLEPHLSRALRTQTRFAALGVVGSAALDVLARLSHAILIVDGAMRVLHANAAAERLLSSSDVLGLSVSGRHLTARASRDASALRQLVFQATGGRAAGLAGGGLLPIERPSGGPVVLAVMPLRADHPWNPGRDRAALVLIGDPERRAPASLEASLHALYGLTPMEAAVAARVGQAETLAAAAEALGVKLSTLRSHLLRAFAKTGTSRQAELVRLVGQLGVLDGGGGEVG